MGEVKTVKVLVIMDVQTAVTVARKTLSQKTRSVRKSMREAELSARSAKMGTAMEVAARI